MLAVSFLVFSSGVKAQDYTYHGTAELEDGSATLYCKISDVSSAWSDGEIRTKNVTITYVPPGESRSEKYGHSDNYSTMTGSWSFGEWYVSSNWEDIE